MSTHFSDGGAGAVDLARASSRRARSRASFQLPLPDSDASSDKIETVATEIYGAGTGRIHAAGARQLDNYERNGFGHLPVCIAKTHLSISADPALLGAPTGHTLTVREVRASVGAGFVYPICGDMRTMPGLGANAGGAIIDFDDDGEIVGLS